jgi:N-acetylglucosamine kinase-like BadF-type ATPase
MTNPKVANQELGTQRLIESIAKIVLEKAYKGDSECLRIFSDATKAARYVRQQELKDDKEAMEFFFDDF